MAPRNHAACVGSYCEAILSGEIVAGSYVQFAVERHLNDLTGIDRLDGGAGSDIIRRDGDDIVINDNSDILLTQLNAAFTGADDWLDDA